MMTALASQTAARPSSFRSRTSPSEARPNISAEARQASRAPETKRDERDMAITPAIRPLECLRFVPAEPAVLRPLRSYLLNGRREAAGLGDAVGGGGCRE